METLIGVCLILITLELGVLVAAGVVVALRVKDVALRVQDTVQAVEVLAYRVESEVENVGSTLRSGWLRTLGAAASVLSGLWMGRRRAG
jgi:hypothetical protein